MANFNTPARINDQTIRLVQFIFALVIARSLLVYQAILLDPFNPKYTVAGVALLVVYMTTVFSWIDWHRSTELNPYKMHLHEKGKDEFLDLVRLLFDLAIVVLYAYLLFSIQAFREDPNVDIHRHLLGYPLVFGGYLLSGLPRRLVYGRRASRIIVLAIFLGVFGALWGGYRIVAGRSLIDLRILNLAFLVGVGLAMISYRLIRRRASRRNVSGDVRIGVDVDGVLADQVSAVLPRVNRAYGTELTYDDIVEWDLPVGTSDIKVEIESALAEEAHVKGLSVYEHAVDALAELRRRAHVVIVTSRDRRSDPWTKWWLRENSLAYDEYINSRGVSKDHFNLDALVEDHGPSVSSFLGSNQEAVAVLIKQPWNRDARITLAKERKEGRLFVVSDMGEAFAVLREALHLLEPQNG